MNTGYPIKHNPYGISEERFQSHMRLAESIVGYLLMYPEGRTKKEVCDHLGISVAYFGYAISTLRDNVTHVEVVKTTHQPPLYRLLVVPTEHTAVGRRA